MEKQIKEMLGELKEFMRYNPTEIYRMAEVLDFGPQEVLEILEDPSAPVEYVTYLYYAMEAVKVRIREEAQEKVGAGKQR